MEEWKTYKLAEICDLIPGFAFKSGDFGDFQSRAIKIGDIQPPYVNYRTMTGVNTEAYNKTKLEKYVVRKGDFVLAMTGATIGKLGLYTEDTSAYLNQRVLLFKPHSDVNKRYIYYSLLSPVFQKYVINHIDSETAQPNISGKSVSGFEISLPSRAEQDRVANILTTIDDKIELNNRINHNLEQQAQALYKSWFVDFEPFKDGKFVDSELGMIPEGWQVVNLDSLCSIISRGFSPKYSNSTTDIVLGQRCVRNNMIDLKVSRTHTPKNLGERALRQYDILINSTGMGSLGRVAQIYFKPERMTFDSHLTLVRAKSSILEMYIGRNLLSRQDEIENMAVGSTGQTELPRDSVKNMSILYPCDVVLKQFGDCIRAITGRIQSNLTENTELALLRDKLLPRLMSGELKINDLTC